MLLPNSASFLRYAYLLGFLSCVALMAAAFYFEYVMFLDPCPLCMLQRVATVLVGIGFLSAFFVSKTPWALRVSLLFTLAACILGLWAADHHVWIQNLPAEDVPACGPSFAYMMDTLPLSDLLNIMLQGNGNCAEIDWIFLGFSMPEWLRLWFIGFLIAVVFALFKTRPRNLR